MSSRGKCWGRGTETGVCLASRRNRGQMAAGWWEQMNRKMVGREIREVVGG